ncbi:MAG: Kup system potassium uptake protein, partial [Caulobacteraceae bacterium]|nr:Kup system potassium uptake protein [Caulobacteraceae bacterium]
YIVVRHCWGWKTPVAAAFIAPFLILDLTFFAANMLKVFTGGWVPLTFGAGICLVMATWVKATTLVREKVAREGLSLTDFRSMMSSRPPTRIKGTAIYLTADPDTTPPALMHSLKHYRVLHERNVVLTVRNETRPYIEDSVRVSSEILDENFTAVTLRYGYMETPNIPQGLVACRTKGLKFDIMSTSFFLSRRTVVPAPNSGMPLWQDRLYIFLNKNAADPASFFHLPPGRVIELGTQVAI